MDGPSVPDDKEEEDVDELAGVDAGAALLLVALQSLRVHSVRAVVAIGRHAVADAARAPIQYPIGDFLEKDPQVSIRRSFSRAH